MSVEASAAPVSDAMEGVVESIPSAEPTTELAEQAIAEDVAPVVPEVIATETLYIQNLNEKIKVDGTSFHHGTCAAACNLFDCSHESYPKSTVQNVWQCSRCNCTPELADAGPSICLI